MEQDNEMKKKILESIVENANKLMGDKLKGKPAMMMVDIKAAHPVDDMMKHPMESDDEEASESPDDKMMEMLHPEMDEEEEPMSPMKSIFGDEEDDGEPDEDLKKLIELHLAKKGKF